MANKKERVIYWWEVGLLGLAASVGAALFLVYEWHIGGRWGFPLDDTWIHLQYARNIAAGGGFSFNAGQPSPGSTAPLWTLCAAALHLLPWSVLYSVKVCGVFLLWLGGILTVCLARSLAVERNWALLGGLVVVWTPRLLWGSLSGMEVVLYMVLATAGLWRHIESLATKPSLLGSGLLGLAALARPECLLLFPLTLVDRWRYERNWQEIGRLYSKHILLIGALFAPFVWFNYSTIGKPFPNTYYAKVGGFGLLGALEALDVGRIVKTLLLYPMLQAQELLQFSAENNVILTCLASLGLVHMLRSQEKGRAALTWIIPLVLLSFPIVRGALAPFKGAVFQHGRYAAHLAPLLVVAGLVGAKVALAQLQAGRDALQVRRLQRWGGALVAVLVVLNLLVIDLKYARTYAWNVDNINDMHVEMGKWLQQNTAADAVIATHDVGAIGYFSQRRLLDTAGLVTPGVLQYLQPGVVADEGVLRYLQREKPDYLVILPNWYPQLAQNTEFFEPIYAITLQNNTIAAGSRMVVYKTKWRQ
jgi:hypothetical protein